MVRWMLGECWIWCRRTHTFFRYLRHFIGTDNLQLAHTNLNEATHRITRRSGHWRGAVALAMVLLGISLTPAQAQQQPYLIGPGDVLRISVFKNPDLSIDARVSEAGTLSYPLIGSVSVGGVALPAAERKIAELLREGGFVLNPQVNILTTLALGGLVSVIGEV